MISDYFGGNAYMDTDEGLRAGNDIMLNTFADGSLTDAASPSAVAAMRRGAHNVLHMMVANSHAMEGIASGSTIRYALAGWQEALIAGDAAVGCCWRHGLYSWQQKEKGSLNKKAVWPCTAFLILFLEPPLNVRRGLQSF